MCFLNVLHVFGQRESKTYPLRPGNKWYGRRYSQKEFLQHLQIVKYLTARFTLPLVTFCHAWQQNLEHPRQRVKAKVGQKGSMMTE
jgi:hypothetical protein